MSIDLNFSINGKSSQKLDNNTIIRTGTATSQEKTGVRQDVSSVGRLLDKASDGSAAIVDLREKQTKLAKSAATDFSENSDISTEIANIQTEIDRISNETFNDQEIFANRTISLSSDSRNINETVSTTDISAATASASVDLTTETALDATVTSLSNLTENARTASSSLESKVAKTEQIESDFQSTSATVAKETEIAETSLSSQEIGASILFKAPESDTKNEFTPDGQKLTAAAKQKTEENQSLGSAKNFIDAIA